jgi:class III lanthionine synthetase
MDKSYELFCLNDPDFYDDSATVQTVEDEPFAIGYRETPSGWRSTPMDDWVVYTPDGLHLPPQGWKIHASATLDNAQQIVETIWEYCIRERVAFKFIRSRQLLLLRNMKYAARGYSGKFVTIFPVDEQQFERILNELGRALDGHESPYILSDLRWGEGPLYVRYGGFTERSRVGPNGELEPAIEGPDGELVSDRRGATFQLPPGVVLPTCLGAHLAARNRATTHDLPYRLDRALHFSNGGGVYGGVDTRTGEQVVLKEARPHAGLARDESDAVARLRRERDTLEQLAGLDVAPAVRDYFVAGGHHFLVMDYIAGQSLNDLIVERYPLVTPDAGKAQIDEFTSWALRVCERMEDAVTAVHERGIVLGDLHPSNVLVEEDDRIVLIDLEIASHVSEKLRPTLADPGFASPAGVTGFDIDDYALACLRLFIFLPLTQLIALEPAKTSQLADEIAQLFPGVPGAFLDGAVRVITDARRASTAANGRATSPPPLEPDAFGWVLARDSMAQAIVSAATPERDDRLFPGDPKQFDTGGLNLAYGAAGVLYALDVTGAGRHPAYEDWLVARAMNPAPGTRIGFYDGLHGVAFTLEHLGRRGQALTLLDICTAELEGKLDRLGLDLSTGLAGIGLNLAHFATQTGDDARWAQAGQIAEVVADRLGDEDSVAELSGGERPYAGLIRGSSGPALLFLRLYEHFRDPVLLDYARTALRQDLRRCIVRDDGAMDVNEGWRTMPYLADGSVGIGLVLADYLTHREDAQFAMAAAAIRKTAKCPFYIESGLFWGRAGMILSLSHPHPPATAAARDAVVASHIRRLTWHATTYQGHLAFPGEELLRLSMDLATGTAGVLLAMGAALHDEPVGLPFLPGAVGAEQAPKRVLTTVEGR